MSQGIQRPLTTQQISGETCRNCKFAKVLSNTPDGQKVCFRNPPQITSFILGRQNDGSPLFGSYAARPNVFDQDPGCGEFRPKLALQ